MLFIPKRLVAMTLQKLVTLKIGGIDVESGLIPVGSFSLVTNLVKAFMDGTTAEEAWKTAKLHLEVEGRASTRASVKTIDAQALRPDVIRFAERAKDYAVTYTDRCAINNSLLMSGGLYIEIIDPETENVLVKIDQAYYSGLKKKEATYIQGFTDAFAYVWRIGGKSATVVLEFDTGERLTCHVGKKLAKKIAPRLYTTVHLSGLATWQPEELRLVDFSPQEIDEDWTDIHLADVLEKNGGLLPITTEFESVDELLAQRTEWRGEEK